MVAGIKSEPWPASNRYPRPACVGIRTLKKGDGNERLRRDVFGNSGVWRIFLFFLDDAIRKDGLRQRVQLHAVVDRGSGHSVEVVAKGFTARCGFPA
jgi:hypothetical protein